MTVSIKSAPFEGIARLQTIKSDAAANNINDEIDRNEDCES